MLSGSSRIHAQRLVVRSLPCPTVPRGCVRFSSATTQRAALWWGAQREENEEENFGLRKRDAPESFAAAAARDAARSSSSLASVTDATITRAPAGDAEVGAARPTFRRASYTSGAPLDASVRPGLSALPTRWGLADDSQGLGFGASTAGVGAQDASTRGKPGVRQRETLARSPNLPEQASSSQPLPSRWHDAAADSQTAAPSLDTLSSQLHAFAEGDDEEGFGLRRAGSTSPSRSESHPTASRPKLAPHAIVVRGLRPNVTKGVVQSVFRRTDCPANSVTVAYDRDGNSLGFAFVEFRTAADVDRAVIRLGRSANKRLVEDLGPIIVAERKIAPDLPIEQMSREEKRRVLHIRNVPYRASESDVERVIKRMGIPYQGFVLPRTPEGKLEGFAQIIFETPLLAAAALDKLTSRPISLGARRLTVEYSNLPAPDLADRQAQHPEEKTREAASIPPNQQLWISGLVPDVADAELARALTQLGAAPQHVRVGRRGLGLRHTFAHARFERVEDAERVRNAFAALGPAGIPDVFLSAEDAQLEYAQISDKNVPRRKPPYSTIFLGHMTALDVTRLDIHKAVLERVKGHVNNGEEAILNIRIMRDGTVAYVDLRDVELAKKFMASHDRKPLEILGRLVRVDYASPSAGHMQAWTPPPADLASPHVVIGDIPLGADDESHLRERLAAALKVLGPAPPLEVELVRDNNGAFIGCAHARYESAQAAQAALDAACDAHGGRACLDIGGVPCRLDFSPGPPKTAESIRQLSRTLFVGNLAAVRITAQELRQACVDLLGRQAVADVRFSADRMVAHVDFNSLADAQEALARGPLRVRDQLLRLDFARQGRRGEVDTFFVRQQEALFVGNLFEATEGDLRALFDDASNGAPYELRLPQPQGECLETRVELESLADAERVLHAHENAQIMTARGSVLHVQFAGGAVPRRGGLPAPVLSVRGLGTEDTEEAVKAAINHAARKPITRAISQERVPMFPHAHVYFQDPRDAMRVFDAHLKRAMMHHGRPLRIEYAIDKQATGARRRAERSNAVSGVQVPRLPVSDAGVPDGKSREDQKWF